MATSFSPEQKAFIREVAREIIPEAIDAHVESCPWGKKLTRAFWVGIGLATGIGMLTGGGLVAVLGK